ncbi:MAG: DUF2294 domain-containing protein [Calditrichaceae bacterium]|nr:DUF2294 domain-containing protein [Calditrichia bacterium]NUQ41166.1 DUF2294 domain-containing protein [Calditrichaceae bacterium]
MVEKTRGQLEAEISVAMTRFEKEHLGRGPKEVRAYIIEDMILVRLKGVLTPAEEKLAADKDGARLIKEIRMRLIENSRPLIEKIIEDITLAKVRTLHTDISSKTGERIILLGLDLNLEAVLIK